MLSACPCGSVVEHSLGKGEVAGPIPAVGTRWVCDWMRELSVLEAHSTADAERLKRTRTPVSNTPQEAPNEQQ